jgi:hypothetical protein
MIGVRAGSRAARLWAGSSAVEHVTFNHGVEGSTPSRLTIALFHVSYQRVGSGPTVIRAASGTLTSRFAPAREAYGVGGHLLSCGGAGVPLRLFDRRALLDRQARLAVAPFSAAIAARAFPIPCAEQWGAPAAMPVSFRMVDDTSDESHEGLRRRTVTHVTCMRWSRVKSARPMPWPIHGRRRKVSPTVVM